jgi:MFS family permease
MKTNRFLGWATAELFFVLSVLAAVLFAILSSDISRELKLNASGLGTVSGAYFVAYAIGQLVLGSLMGTFSARFIIGITALLSGAGALVFGFSTGVTAAVFAHALLGLGLSTSFVGVIYVVSRNYAEKFAFMSALSQGLVNASAAALALLSAFIPFLLHFRAPFLILGVLLLVNAALLFVFVGGGPKNETREAARLPFLPALKVIFTNGQFWAALVYYAGLFGAVLAFSDLWNIQFQIDFFKHTVAQSTILNSMVPLGVLVGCLVSGWWANRTNFVLPSRLFGLLSVALFVVLILVPLPTDITGVMMFLLGFGLSASILAFTAIQKHLPSGAAAPATAIIITVAYVFGGAIQPLVGAAIASPHPTFVRLPLIPMNYPAFWTYQRGLIWILGAVVVAVIASFFFKASSARPEKSN